VSRGGLVLAAIILLALSGCSKSSDPAVAARIFLDALATGDTHTAYTSSAFALRAQRPEPMFAAVAHSIGLIGSEVAITDSPSIRGRTAKLSIEVRKPRVASRPLVMTLVDQSGKWRVFSIKSPPDPETGIAENFFTTIGKGIEPLSPAERPMPDEQTIKAMARETLLQFNDAIHQRTFEDFYDHVSRAWQRKLTLGMLRRSFQGFIDRQPRLAGIRDSEVQLGTPPRIDDTGLLIVAGSFPTKPYRVAFSLEFTYEMPNWRVFGLNVNLLR
jgi:hypothetical protein